MNCVEIALMMSMGAFMVGFGVGGLIVMVLKY